MQEKIITIYCVCADFLVAYGHKDDAQTQMTTAEVMTVALVAAHFFTGNQELSRLFLKEHGYIPKMLSKSRLNRRLHAISDTCWQALFALLGEIAKQSNPTQEYIVDSCPVPACDNIRIFGCRLYQGPAFRGKVASKKRFVYGLRVHLLVTATGLPVEFVLAPASQADLSGLKSLALDLPSGAEVYADAAYTDYALEDSLQEVADIRLTVPRKKNSKRSHPGWVTYICERTRKRVETTFSRISQLFARSIHAVTPRGFELKVFLSVLAVAITG
jgi:transposase